MWRGIHVPHWTQLQETQTNPPNTTGHAKRSACVGLNCALPATGAGPRPARSTCPVLPNKLQCVGDCHTMEQLFRGGSDLAERREVQRCQCTVEHVPHCSQQLEAGKHLLKEMRERLLQGERRQLGAGGQTAPREAGPAGIAACAPSEDGTGGHCTAGTIPHVPAPQKDCRATGLQLGPPTHPQDVHPVVVGAEIHAELDQELAHLQGRDILVAQ